MSDEINSALDKTADQVASSNPSLVSGIFNRGSASLLSSCRLQTGRTLRLEHLPVSDPGGSSHEPATRYSWFPAAGHCPPINVPRASQMEFADAGSPFVTDPSSFMMTLNGLDGMVAWSVSEYFSQDVEENAHREMAEVLEAGSGGRVQILKEATACNRAAGNQELDVLPLCASLPRQRAVLPGVAKCRSTPKHVGARQIRPEGGVSLDTAAVKVRAHGDAIVRDAWRKTAWVDAIAKRPRSRRRMSVPYLLQSAGKTGVLFQQPCIRIYHRICLEDRRTPTPVHPFHPDLVVRVGQLESDQKVPSCLSCLVTQGNKALIQGGLAPHILSSSLERVCRQQVGSFEYCCQELVFSWQKKLPLGCRVALTGSRRQHFQVPPQFLLRATCRLSSLKLFCAEIAADPHCTWERSVMKREDLVVLSEPYGCARNATRAAGTATMYELGRVPCESVDAGSLTANEQPQAVGNSDLEHSWIDKQPAMLMFPDLQKDREEPQDCPTGLLEASRAAADWSCRNVYKAGDYRTEAASRPSTAAMDAESQMPEIMQPKLDHQVQRRCGWVIRVAVARLVRRRNVKKSSRSLTPPLASRGGVTHPTANTAARLPVAKTGKLLRSYLVGTILAFRLFKSKTSGIARMPTHIWAMSLVAGVLSLITLTLRLRHKTTHPNRAENLSERGAGITRAAALKAMSPYNNILLFLNRISVLIRQDRPPVSMKTSLVHNRGFEVLATSEM